MLASDRHCYVTFSRFDPLVMRNSPGTLSEVVANVLLRLPRVHKGHNGTWL